MNRIFFPRVIFLLIGVLSTAPAMSGILLGPIINPANSHTYYLLTPDQTWTEAEAEAVALGGHLVTINDQAEQDWVWSTFGINSERWLWIGFNDVNQEGTFEWVSGEPVTYTNWTPGEPNNFPPGEDYGEMDAFKGGKWNDLQETAWAFRHYGVVEINSSTMDLIVEIDIKPFDDTNKIYLDSSAIWVALMSDTSSGSPFDPYSQVDLSTVGFGPGEATAFRTQFRDVNADGLGDFLFQFLIRETGIQCGDTEAMLTGQTFDTQAFTGTDSIRTKRCQ